MAPRNRRSYRVIRWEAEFVEVEENTPTEASPEAPTEARSDNDDEAMKDTIYQDLPTSPDEAFFGSHLTEYTKSDNDHATDDYAIHVNATDYVKPGLSDTPCVFRGSSYQIT